MTMESSGDPIIRDIHALLADLYHEREALLWLDSPHRLLDGATPNQLIRRGKGDEVLRLLRQIDEGTYT